MSSKRKPPATSVVATDVPVTTIREPPSAPKLPTILKFPLVVLITFSLTVLVNTVMVEFTGPKLYPVSRNLNENWQAGAIVTWKVLELGIGWFAGFDDLDMLSFTILTHLPHAYLLSTFYLVPTVAVLTFLATECAASIPFRLLRRRNAHHNAPTATALTPAPTSDLSTAALISAVASAMYALPVVLSLVTWLPVHLVTSFDGLVTLAPARSVTLWLMLLIMIPMGYSANDLIFKPAASTASTVPLVATDGVSGEKTLLEFDPETATLTQTLHRNIFWHMYLPARTQELLKRTILLSTWTVANTAFLAYTEVEGAEIIGALGWSGVWGLGAVSAGAMLGWVAGVIV